MAIKPLTKTERLDIVRRRIFSAIIPKLFKFGCGRKNKIPKSEINLIIRKACGITESLNQFDVHIMNEILFQLGAKPTSHHGKNFLYNIEILDKGDSSNDTLSTDNQGE